VRITFEETQNPQIAPAFALWHDSIYDEDKQSGIQEERLKADIWVRQIRSDEDVPLHSVAHIYAACPSVVGEPQMNYGGRGLVTFDVTFDYDIWRYELWPF
jgi:hypothetical protein